MHQFKSNIFSCVSRNDLEVKAYNDCVMSDSGQIPYGLSWYLDAVSDWDVLVGEGYEWVMPLPYNLKIPWKKQLIQPFYTQQLGIYGRVLESKEKKEVQNYLSSYFWQIRYHCPLSQVDYFPKGSHIQKRTNYLLPLDQSYDHIQKNYSASLRQRVRKYRPKLQLSQSNNINEFIEFYRLHLQQKVRLPASSYRRLNGLITEAMRRKQGYIVSVSRPKEKKPIMQGFHLVVGNRIINLAAIGNKDGRRFCANHIYLDHLIRSYASSEYILDFEGSDIAGIASFFASFGSNKKTYASISALQWPYRLFYSSG